VILDAALRRDLCVFVGKTFQTVAPESLYLHNWHIDAVVHALMQTQQGKCKRLIITQPPRSLKSICISVAFVAWALGHDPSRRYACVSYSQDLAATFARQFRAVITSEWYRALFPNVRLTKDTESECVTSVGGGRVAISVGGSFTGRGADFIIIDDPIKAEDAQSDGARRTVSEWYRTTLLSRLNNKERGVIILVMQRLHEDDLVGNLLREGGWEHLDIPAIAQEDQIIPIGLTAVYHRHMGDALHEARESLVTLELMKREMGSLAFSAQYLQRPIPLDGNLVKRSWIKWYEESPTRANEAQVVQSWDVASTAAATSDWSVCSTWLARNRNYYLLDVWRGRLEFPHLKQKLIQLARQHLPRSILIEQAGPGLHLIQEFRANPAQFVPVPIGIHPEGDKIIRMEAQSARFEAGQVHLPKEAPWLDELLRELLAFPNARHDDQIDSVSQFLNWIERRGNFPTVATFGPIIVYG